MPKSLKTTAQRLLKQAGVYHRIQASCLYDLYWTIADESLLESRAQEISFYHSLLPWFRPGDIIFDVGANHGHKTDVFLRMGARVLAVEPDEVNQQILKRKFLWLRLPKKSVIVIGQALDEDCSTRTMWLDAPGSAKNTLSRKWVDTLRTDDKRFGAKLEFTGQKSVETTTLDRLIEQHGPPAFIKIDVEGYEPNVLRGLSRPVPCVSFEVNLPEFEPEGLECITLLDRLDPQGQFNLAVDCREGLRLPKWLGTRAFMEVFKAVQENSIEVFWTSSASKS